MSDVQFEMLDGAAHHWWFGDDDPSAEHDPNSVLSVEELDRSRRLRRPAARRWYRRRRGTLRHILARYAPVPAADLVIARRCERCGDPDHGRPRLVGVGGLSFSTSSRPGRGVVAIATTSRVIGVDFELVDTDAADAVSRVSLTTGEQDAIADADAAAVVRLWCRKEALVKSTGSGLVGTDAAHVDVRGDVVSGHHLRDVWSPAGSVAAIATVGRVDQVVARRWPGADPLGLDTTAPS